MKFKIFTLPLTIILVACSQTNSVVHSDLNLEAVYTGSRVVSHFDDYVHFLKRKAANEGVSEKTLNEQKFIHYNTRAVQLDHQQAARKWDPNLPSPKPNRNGVTQYLNKVLTQAKVEQATKRLYEYDVILARIGQQYGVQKEYIIALWGMESSFGRYQGNFDVLSVLATLAFDGRREQLFTQEFINAMKMLDEGIIKRHELVGSWAGAMGQAQFMPTSYLTYAADGNGDGKKDIWNNEADVFASIAKYLATVGWDDKQPWGVEVKLSNPMDLDFSGIEENKSKTFTEWQALGVYLAYPNGQEISKLDKLNGKKLWLIRPDKEVGRAFLVSNNYRTLIDWNRSHNFAISIGKFADRILSSID